jgi:hypothetical protein
MRSEGPVRAQPKRTRRCGARFLRRETCPPRRHPVEGAGPPLSGGQIEALHLCQEPFTDRPMEIADALPPQQRPGKRPSRRLGVLVDPALGELC